MQAAIAVLAALNRRVATGMGQYIDVAMAATLMAVNEHAHVDLNDADLGDEPAILGATASARKANLAALHDIIRTWIVTFADMGTLDAKFDEAKIAMGEMRSLQALSETDWSGYWGAVQEVSDRRGGTSRLPGRPWRFSADLLEPIDDPAFQGEHNCDVFRELGMSVDEIARFIATGALVSAVTASTTPMSGPTKV